MAGMSLKERTIEWRNLIVWYRGVDCGIILKWVDCENVNRLVVNLCCFFFCNSVEPGGFSNQIRKQPSNQRTVLTNKLTARFADFLQLRLLMHLIKTFTVGYLHNEPCPEPRKLFMHLWSNPALSIHLGTTLKRMNIRCWRKYHYSFSLYIAVDPFDIDLVAKLTLKHEAWSMLQPNSALLGHMLCPSLFFPPPIPFTSVRCRIRVSGCSDQGLIRICCIDTFILYSYLFMYDMYYVAYRRLYYVAWRHD